MTIRDVPEHEQVTLAGFGRATMCAVAAATSHRPVPLRFVWHHIQPQEARGATVAANLVQLCDSCHYTVHRLLWQMAHGLPLSTPHRAAALALATQGYVACSAAGTLALIPNEG